MELRPGYKLTEVGVIPEDWGVSDIGGISLVPMQNGLFYEPSKKGRGVPLINVGDMYAAAPISIDRLDLFDANAKQVQTFRAQKGDLFFTRSSVVPSGIAYCNILEGGNSSDVVFDSHLIRVRADASVVDTRYLYLNCISKRTRNYLVSSAKTATMTTIDQRALKRCPVLIPPITEQRAIATALSDVDTLLDGLDRLIAKKRDIKQAAMQQLLTGKTRLPGFEGEWEVKQFSSVLNRINAKSYQIQTSEYHTTGAYPVVDQGKEPVVGFSDIEAKRFRCPEGGVIVFGDHTCIVKFIDFDFLVGADGTQILCGKAGQSTRFHAFQLQYRGVDPTGYNRHFKHLKEKDYLVPPPAEQNAIATVLSDMDAELEALVKRRAKTADLKQAMMQELLTGRTRLV